MEEQLLPPTLLAAVRLQVTPTLEPTHVRTVLHFEETIGTVEELFLYHLCIVISSVSLFILVQAAPGRICGSELVLL